MKHRRENAERFSNAACREENNVMDARNIKMSITETFYKGVMMMMMICVE